MQEQSSRWTGKIGALCQWENSGCLYIWDRWDLQHPQPCLASGQAVAVTQSRAQSQREAPLESWTRRGWSWDAVINVLRPQTKSQKQGSISRISPSDCVLRMPKSQQPRKLLFGTARSLRCQGWLLWLTDIIEELFSKKVAEEHGNLSWIYFILKNNNL